jgi:hypothetical protein
MEQQALGAGDTVDGLIRELDLIVGQGPCCGIVERGTAQQSNLGIAVEIDLFEKVLELVAIKGDPERILLTASQFCVIHNGLGSSQGGRCRDAAVVGKDSLAQLHQFENQPGMPRFRVERPMSIWKVLLFIKISSKYPVILYCL